MNQVSQKGHGKINLGLEILYKREDGYHEVDMILQSVQLHDVITLTKRDEGPAIVLTSNHWTLPLDHQNIAYRAAQLLQDQYPLDMHLDIHIDKQIPMAAGMAGGSADAAAVLRGVNELYGLGLSLEELATMGLSLGADVPFCIYEGCARARGIGEKLTLINGLSHNLPILIIKPKIGVSTAKVYQALELDHRQMILMDQIEQALDREDTKDLSQYLENRLEDVVFDWHPNLAEYKHLLKEQGALFSAMSGSGSTIFGVFANEAHARSVKDLLENDQQIEALHITYAFTHERMSIWKR